MSTRLQLDGPDLATLLEQVQQEYGDAARIVEAGKVRSGGINGFFAKEHFTMTVELPGPGDPQPEAGRAPDDSTVPPAAPAVAEVVPQAPASEPSADVPDLLALADGVSDQEVSTTRRSFAEVLERLAAGAVADGDDAQPEPKADAAPADTAPATARTTVMFAPLQPSSPASPPRRVLDAAEPAATTQRTATEPVDLVRAERRGSGQQPALTAGPSGRGRRLAALGLPAELVPDDGPDLHAALCRALRGLTVPSDPVPAAGELVVLTGPRDAAVTAARALRRRWELDDRVAALVAGSARGLAFGADVAATSQDVEQAHASAVAAHEPLVVCVDERLIIGAPALRRDWVERLLAEASVVWAVARASTKPSDVRRLADRAGADALVLVDCDETGDPAAVLRAGVPVARLDDRPATAAGWASLLCERLAEVT